MRLVHALVMKHGISIGLMVHLQVTSGEAPIGGASDAAKETAKALAAGTKRTKRSRAMDTPSSIQSRPPLAIRPPAWSGASCGGPMVTGPVIGMGPTHCYMQVTPHRIIIAPTACSCLRAQAHR
jgi:hypothetical protein